MADQNTSVALDLNIDTNAPEAIAEVTEQVKTGVEAYKELRTETRGLTGDVLSATKGTAEYNAQLTALAKHRSEFTDLRQDIRALDPREQTLSMARFGETGVRAFTGIAGAATLAAGGNDKMVKIMMEGFAVTQVMESALAVGELKRQANSIQNLLYTKLQTAGYIEQGAAVSGLTILQGILNAVTAAWPIAILIAGVAAIAIAVKEWNGGLDNIVEAQDKIIERLKTERETAEATHNVVKAALQNELDLLVAENAGYKAIEAAKERIRLSDAKNVQEQIDNANATIIAMKAKNRALDEESHIGMDIAAGFTKLVGLHSDEDEKLLKAQKDRNKEVDDELTKVDLLIQQKEKLTAVDPIAEQKTDTDKSDQDKLKAKQITDGLIESELKDSVKRQLALLKDQHDSEIQGLDKSSKEYYTLKKAYDLQYIAGKKKIEDDAETAELERQKRIADGAKQDAEAGEQEINTRINLENTIRETNEAVALQQAKDGLDLEIALESNFEKDKTAIQQEGLDERKERADKEKKIVELQLQRDLLDAQDNQVAIVKAHQKAADAIKAIDKDVSDKKKSETQETFDAVKKAESTLNDVLTQMSSDREEAELKSVGNNLIAQDAIKRKYFEQDKTAKEAQAIINGALAITGILIKDSENPIGAAMLAFDIASTIATTALAVDKISSSTYNGGGGSLSSISGVSQNAPNVTTTFGTSSPTQGVNGNISSQANTTTRAYIVQSDLNQAQLNQTLQFKYRKK